MDNVNHLNELSIQSQLSTLEKLVADAEQSTDARRDFEAQPRAVFQKYGITDLQIKAGNRKVSVRTGGVNRKGGACPRCTRSISSYPAPTVQGTWTVGVPHPWERKSAAHPDRAVPSRFFRKLIEAASAPPCSSPPPPCSARPSPPASTCPGTSSCPIRAPRCTSASPSPASGPSCRPGRSLRLSSSA